MLETLKDMTGIFTRWHCWYLFSAQDIAMRYKRSVVGPFWISLSMGAFILGVSFVYARLFGAPFQDYLNRVATGYLMWHYLASMINEGSHSVMEAATSLKSISLPISVMAARVVARNIVVLLHNFVAVIPIMIVFGSHHFTLQVLWVIPGLAVYILLGVLVGMALGPIGARYRDISELLKTVTHLAFFVTPVIWPADRVDPDAFYIKYNPFYHLIELLRAPLLGAPATLDNWVMAVAFIAVALAGAMVSVRAASGRLVLWV